MLCEKFLSSVYNLSLFHDPRPTDTLPLTTIPVTIATLGFTGFNCCCLVFNLLMASFFITYTKHTKETHKIIPKSLKNQSTLNSRILSDGLSIKAMILANNPLEPYFITPFIFSLFLPIPVDKAEVKLTLYRETHGYKTTTERHPTIPAKNIRMMRATLIVRKTPKLRVPMSSAKNVSLFVP